MSDTLNIRIREFNRAIAEADLLRDPVKPVSAEAQQRRIINTYLDMMEGVNPDDFEQ